MNTIRLHAAHSPVCLLISMGLVTTMVACEPTSSSSAPNEQANTPSAPEPPPVDPAVALQEKRDGWAGALCNGYLGCYDQHGVMGQVDGVIIMDVGADGGVMATSYTGSAPVPVQECISTMFGSRRLEGYDEDGGQVTCTYSGTYNNGMMMLSQSWEYTPGPPRAAAAAAGTQPAGGGAAKDGSGDAPVAEGSGELQ